MGRCSDAKERLVATAASLFHQRGYTPEGAILPATVMASNTVVQFVSDDDTLACWKSFTTRLGEANQPVLRMLAPSNNLPRFNLQLPPGRRRDDRQGQ